MTTSAAGHAAARSPLSPFPFSFLSSPTRSLPRSKPPRAPEAWSPVVPALGSVPPLAVLVHLRSDPVPRDQICPFPPSSHVAGVPTPAVVIRPLPEPATVASVLQLREQQLARSSVDRALLDRTRLGRPRLGPASSAGPKPLHRLGQSPWVSSPPSARTLCTFGPASFGPFFSFPANLSICPVNCIFTDWTLNFMHIITHKPCIFCK